MGIRFWITALAAGALAGALAGCGGSAPGSAEQPEPPSESAPAPAGLTEREESLPPQGRPSSPAPALPESLFDDRVTASPVATPETWTTRVHGWVLDEEDEPIADARVALLAWDYTEISAAQPVLPIPQEIAAVRTDADGFFAIFDPDLPLPDPQQPHRPRFAVAGAPGRATRMVNFIHVPASRAAPLSIRLESAEEIPARVVQSDGSPADDWHLQLVGRGFRTVTLALDRSGRLAIPAGASGSPLTPYVALPDGRRFAAARSLGTIREPPSGAARFTLEFTRAPLRGRVMMPGQVPRPLADTEIDFRARGISADLRAGYHPQEPPPSHPLFVALMGANEFERRLRTDAAGRFEIPDFVFVGAPRRVDMSVTHAGEPPPSGPPGGQYSVEGEGEKREFVFALMARDTFRARIRREGTHEPLPGVAIRFYHRGQEHAPLDLVTDETGEISVPAVDRSEMHLELRSPGLIWANGDRIWQPEPPFNPMPLDELEVEPGSDMMVLAFDPDGNPLPDVRVNLRHWQGPVALFKWLGTTGEVGRLQTAVSPGLRGWSVAINGEHEEWPMVVADAVSVEPGMTVELKALPLIDLSVRVEDSRGYAPDSGDVRLSPRLVALASLARGEHRQGFVHHGQRSIRIRRGEPALFTRVPRTEVDISAESGGLVAGEIFDLTDPGFPSEITLSLHSPDETVRRGVVYDSLHRPIEGALVASEWQRNQIPVEHAIDGRVLTLARDERVPTHMARTDAEGRFELPTSDATREAMGHQMLWFDAPGHRAFEWPLRPDEEVIWVELAPEAILRGRLAGTEVDGNQLSLTATFRLPQGEMRPNMQVIAHGDLRRLEADGSFVYALPVGRSSPRLPQEELEPLSPLPVTAEIIFRHRDRIAAARVAMSQCPSQERDLGTLTLTLGHTLRMRVEDEAGNPLEGALVSAYPHVPLIQHVPTDQNGELLIPGFWDGEKMISVYYPEHHAEGARIDMTEDVDLALTMRPLESRTAIVTVLGLDGLPVEGCQVRLTHTQREGDFTADQLRQRLNFAAPTDATGEVLFEGVPHGRYRLWLWVTDPATGKAVQHTRRVGIGEYEETTPTLAHVVDFSTLVPITVRLNGVEPHENGRAGYLWSGEEDSEAGQYSCALTPDENGLCEAFVRPGPVTVRPRGADPIEITVTEAGEHFVVSVE